jgi:aminopeptidase N
MKTIAVRLKGADTWTYYTTQLAAAQALQTSRPMINYALKNKLSASRLRQAYDIMYADDLTILELNKAIEEKRHLPQDALERHIRIIFNMAQQKGWRYRLKDYSLHDYITYILKTMEA